MTTHLLLLLGLTTAAVEVNEFGWPTELEENLAEIREIQKEVPNKLLTNDPAEGTFIVLLSESTADTDPRRGRRNLRAGMSFSEQVDANKRAMERISKEIPAQTPEGQFCGQVVSQHANLNMMVVITSPHCTKWLAKRHEVEVMEVDGHVQAYQAPPAVRRLRGTRP